MEQSLAVVKDFDVIKEEADSIKLLKTIGKSVTTINLANIYLWAHGRLWTGWGSLYSQKTFWKQITTKR